ncbi:MAG: hypothetical protein ACI898_001335 [Flavobacteriales bacterium]
MAKFKKQAKQRALDFDLKIVLPMYEALYELLLKK